MFLIKTKRDDLLVPLQWVLGVVERRQTQAILSNVLLEKIGDRLNLLATDNEIQIRTSCPVSGEGDGALTVSARKLQDILRALPDALEISLSLNEKRLQIRSGKSRFSLQTLPPDDFPRMRLSTELPKKFTLSQKNFRQLLAKTQFSMATQDVRYFLNGLLILIENAHLSAVATDGHRLAYAGIPLDSDNDSARQELILPRKTVSELHRLLADNDDPLAIEITANQVRFEFGNILLVSKLIDGKFPDYERVIPSELKNTISLNKNDFLQSVIRAAILTSDKFRGVRLLLSENTLKIITTNTDQEDAQEEIELSYEGPFWDVGFNVSYLLDILNYTTSETVNLSFNDGNSSVLLTIPDDAHFKYVVMPMRV
ncbi:MAG: DNA polymerase III subunit beta [Pseudomonadota bacterium]